MEDELDASVPAAVRGDREAIEWLLKSIRPLVVRYCRARLGRIGRSYVSADDVAQEVCLDVLTALPGYQDQGKPFLAYVYGIAAHKVADWHRAMARDRTVPVSRVPEVPLEEAGPDRRVMVGELSVRMTTLLRELSDRQREILLLRVVVGLTAEETARVVGASPGTVRVAQHRALVRLRKALAADDTSG